MNLKTGVSRKQIEPNFPKNEHFLPPDTHTYVQGVRNVRFSENLAYFVFLKHLFWDSSFCLITDELLCETVEQWKRFSDFCTSPVPAKILQVEFELELNKAQGSCGNVYRLQLTNFKKPKMDYFPSSRQCFLCDYSPIFCMNSNWNHHFFPLKVQFLVSANCCLTHSIYFYRY